MSATPEQIAERLEAWAEEERDAARYHEAGGSFLIMGACEAQEDKLRAAAALIRAQADALKRIAEMDGDQPARSDWDMVRIARAALKAAP